MKQQSSFSPSSSPSFSTCYGDDDTGKHERKASSMYYSSSPTSSEKPSEGGGSNLHKHSSFSFSSSEATEPSSEEIFFQLDAAALGNTVAAAAPDSDGSSRSFFSYSPSNDETPRPTLAPAVQTMAGPPAATVNRVDPSRIPPSIFGKGPPNLAEWSVTSNESLFSIHFGRLSDLGALNGNSPQFHYFYDVSVVDVSSLGDVLGLHRPKGSPTPESAKPSGAAKGNKYVTFRDRGASDESAESNLSFAFQLPAAEASPSNNTSRLQPPRPASEIAKANARTAERRSTSAGGSWFACSFCSCYACCGCSCCRCPRWF